MSNVLSKMILLTPQVFNNLISKSKPVDQNKSNAVVKPKKQRKRVLKPFVSEKPSEKWIKTKKRLDVLPSLRNEDTLFHKVDKTDHSSRPKVFGVRRKVVKNEKKFDVY